MSWKRTGTRTVKQPTGHYVCDRCGKRIPVKDDGGSLFLYDYRAHLHYGSCCEQEVIDILRKGGFKFRLSPREKESR